VKQLSLMLFAEQKAISRKELVLIQHQIAMLKLHNPQLWLIFPTVAEGADVLIQIHMLLQFQIKDGFKAARRSATKAYTQYIEETMTSQRRRRFDMEVELLRQW
jgi:hypothetical protein